LVARTEDLDIVTICDTRSIRLYHVVHARIGQHFVGGDEGPALAGESYMVDGVGTLGLQRRAFCPVRDKDGTVLGLVVASTTMLRLQTMREEITRTYEKLAVVVVFASLLVAGLLSLYIHRILLGHGPEELIHSYLTQSDMLNNLDEGIVSVDSQGKIQLVNRAAIAMLAQGTEPLEGELLDRLIRDERGESLLTSSKGNVPTSRPNVLCCSIPLEKENRRTGTTLILMDRTEAMRSAERLNGTRHIVSTLRANTHEFMNKLQVIFGLIQMGRQQEALSYIGDISATHAESVGPVLQHIHNPNVAALILGKLNNMRELGIRLTLLANSDLPEHSAYLSTSNLVTVVGNLLENGMEAVNAKLEDGPRSIVLQITEDAHGLLISLSDTGTGISPEILPRIYEPDFSTKATEGRGTGMSLVREIVDRSGGSIEVDSDPSVGTSFTIICNRQRERK
ncbi:MAG: sensor histidine kinase, partial [Oscillibacter sp.]